MNRQEFPVSFGANHHAVTTDAAHDPVNHPSHYTSHPSGVECIDIIEWFPHNLAAAMGYIWRSEHKGHKEQDLRKAIWHLNREIERSSKLKKESA